MFIDFFKRFYLFLGRQEGREKKRREASMCGCFSHAPDWGPGPQPRHVPWLGNEPVSLWFAGWCSVHWATPARASLLILERGEGRLRERGTRMWERNVDWLPPICTPSGDRTCNLGICPEQGSSKPPLGAETMLQLTEPPTRASPVSFDILFP